MATPNHNRKSIAAIRRAVKLVKGPSALATLIRVKRQQVQAWTTGVRPIPAHHCKTIETATGGKVRCIQLRPDVF